jgi:predicted NAD-dependent protein-ADP-ribosyltransferase YbiA (DUF1768 family)
MSSPTRIALTLFCVLAAFPASADEPALERDAKYPAEWWKTVPEKEGKSWEILPQAAKAGEVILSKRNELGILSNFAATPFTLRGVRYASLEGLWQSMKYPEGPEDARSKHAGLKWPYTRKEVTQLVAFKAMKAGRPAGKNMKTMGIDWVTFDGKQIRYKAPGKEGADAHYAVILAASRAKVAQNPKVAALLLKTGDLKLLPDHRQSKTATPAYRYFKIYMKIRAELRSAAVQGPSAGALNKIALASELTLHSLDPRGGAKGGFHGYKILGSLKLGDAARPKALAAVAKSIRESKGVQAKCFEPRHGLHAVLADGSTVDLVICFVCMSLELHADNAQQSVTITRAGKDTLNALLDAAKTPRDQGK